MRHDALAGHSLGGVMAVLAAYDIAKLFPWQSMQVYTVGAPRPGNKAFAAKYGSAVPATWHIINPKVGFASQLFKRSCDTCANVFSA